MDQWTKTKGFPVIVVSREESTDLNSQTFNFVQTSCHKNDLETTWKIPLSYVTSEGYVGRILLEDREARITLPVPKEVIIRFNHDSITFCTIIYNPDFHQTLCKFMHKFSIHNRIGFNTEIL